MSITSDDQILHTLSQAKKHKRTNARESVEVNVKITELIRNQYNIDNSKENKIRKAVSLRERLRRKKKGR